MIKVTETRAITHYLGVHRDEERRGEERRGEERRGEGGRRRRETPKAAFSCRRDFFKESQPKGFGMFKASGWRFK
jgi:hypothetical protein